jgi:hypothetical protein
MRKVNSTLMADLKDRPENLMPLFPLVGGVLCVFDLVAELQQRILDVLEAGWRGFAGAGGSDRRHLATGTVLAGGGWGVEEPAIINRVYKGNPEKISVLGTVLISINCRGDCTRSSEVRCLMGERTVMIGAAAIVHTPPLLLLLKFLYLNSHMGVNSTLNQPPSSSIIGINRINLPTGRSFARHEVPVSFGKNGRTVSHRYLQTQHLGQEGVGPISGKRTAKNAHPAE